jgi:hypothetical protein
VKEMGGVMECDGDARPPPAADEADKADKDDANCIFKQWEDDWKVVEEGRNEGAL